MDGQPDSIFRRSKNLEENDCDRRKKKVFLMFSERNRNRNEVSAYIRGTQRECSSKPLKHSIVKRILVFKR